MFFIGIFGIENKEKKIKDVYNIVCKKCNGGGSGQLIKSYNYFHFFFIPLIKWNIKYHLVCNNCKAIYEIITSKGKDAEKGKSEDFSYWDMKEIYREELKKVCPSCRNEIEDKYSFCPYCGEKIKSN